MPWAANPRLLGSNFQMPLTERGISGRCNVVHRGVRRFRAVAHLGRINEKAQPCCASRGLPETASRAMTRPRAEAAD